MKSFKVHGELFGILRVQNFSAVDVVKPSRVRFIYSYLSNVLIESHSHSLLPSRHLPS